MTYGLTSFLNELDTFSRYHATQRASLVHIITPAPRFTDRGKSSLEIPEEFSDELARAMFLAGQTLYKDKKRREKNPGHKAAPHRQKAPPLTEVLFVEPGGPDDPNLIEQGFAIASGPDELPVPAHSLFYQVRPLVERWYLDRGYEPKMLESHYFEQNLLVRCTSSSSVTFPV